MRVIAALEGLEKKYDLEALEDERDLYEEFQLVKLSECVQVLHGDNPLFGDVDELSLIVEACNIQHWATLARETKIMEENCEIMFEWGTRERGGEPNVSPMSKPLRRHFPSSVAEMVVDFVGYECRPMSVLSAFVWFTELLITKFDSEYVTLSMMATLFDYVAEREIKLKEDRGSWMRRILVINAELFRCLEEILAD